MKNVCEMFTALMKQITNAITRKSAVTILITSETDSAFESCCS
jgi:hypothetical protein